MADLAFVALTWRSSRLRPRSSRGEAAVSAENAVGLVLAVLLVGYLLVALLFPERF